MRIGAAFESILAAAQGGAPWAYGRLWRTFAPAVASYLRLQGAPDPDDLCSEAFLGAFRRLGTFSGGEDDFRGWLFTIAHRRLPDARRRAGARPQWGGEAVPEAAGGNVEDDALRVLGAARVRELCEGLAPAQRDVLLLRLVADLTVDQVAAALDRTPGAVKALPRRGLEALRGLLCHEGVPL